MRPGWLRAGVLTAGLLLCSLAASAQAAASLESLPVITTIAYVTAHPDDESGAVISYFARGLGARVVILCLTRGEGGQNTYGPELGEELARVRTAELEAASRIFGAEVFFLDAPDFGYSKSVEETLRYWNERALVERLVRVLRELKADVVISRWTPNAPAGAQHQAAGIVSRQAYALVGDPAVVPEVEAWPVRYFLTHAGGPGDGENIRVPTEEVDPRSGKSFAELAWEGIRQHRSQGLDSIPREVFQGRRYFLRMEALRQGAAVPLEARNLVERLDTLPVLFPAVRVLSNWQQRLFEVVRLAEEASRAIPAEAAEKLIAGAEQLERLRAELEAEGGAGLVHAVIEAKRDAFLRQAATLAGVEVMAAADRARVVPGEAFRLRMAASAPAGISERLKLSELEVVTPSEWLVETVLNDASAAGLVREVSVTPPATAALGRLPVEASAVLAGVGRVRLPATIQSPRGGPVEVVPRVRLALEPALRLVPMTLAGGMLDWEVRIERNALSRESAPVALEVPVAWTSPLPQSLPAQDAAVVRLRFQVLLPGRLEPGSTQVRAALPGAATAEAGVQVVELRVPHSLRIGYIGFNNDPVPALLAQLGIGVDMLEESLLARAALDGYDAIVIAERAYDFRADLPEATARLLGYVRQGGTLVVEHQGRGWDPAKFAPYWAENSGNLRVTDETATVRVLAPEHPALNFPHRLGAEDWEGWVQERGLYFLSQWDERYVPLVEMADPGEEPLRGGLLYARDGKGVYIYCGLALFRQVRAGVPGGIRLFVNLLSQRRAARGESVLPPRL